ncbi:MAG: HAD family hydrolase [Spirochaetaceae bacterium]|jgi:putative hydrolase of the HAD superfamily|nr:HAD family hydrolase [Spirochaetaceae bacterium]
MKKFDAIAFDLDGTLYPNWRFYLRLMPQVITHLPLLTAFRKARSILHRTTETGNFYRRQAEICAKYLNIDSEAAFQKIESHIYNFWPLQFKSIKLYPRVRETMQLFKDNNLKLGVLSDFKLKDKLEYLKLNGIFDAELCSEQIGVLKPNSVPFNKLAQELQTDPKRILYVGNSVKFDIFGAKNAGFGGTALIYRGIFKNRRSFQVSDLCFSDYRQLQRFVLE